MLTTCSTPKYFQCFILYHFIFMILFWHNRIKCGDTKKNYMLAASPTNAQITQMYNFSWKRKKKTYQNATECWAVFLWANKFYELLNELQQNHKRHLLERRLHDILKINKFMVSIGVKWREIFNMLMPLISCMEEVCFLCFILFFIFLHHILMRGAIFF